MIRDLTFYIILFIFHLYIYIYCILTVYGKNIVLMNDLCSLGSDVVYFCILHCCIVCVGMTNIVTDDMTSALHFSVRIYRYIYMSSI